MALVGLIDMCAHQSLSFYFIKHSSTAYSSQFYVLNQLQSSYDMTVWCVLFYDCVQWQPRFYSRPSRAELVWPWKEFNRFLSTCKIENEKRGYLITFYSQGFLSRTVVSSIKLIRLDLNANIDSTVNVPVFFVKSAPFPSFMTEAKYNRSVVMKISWLKGKKEYTHC